MFQGLVGYGTKCCKKVDEYSETYYEVPDGVKTIYDKAENVQDEFIVEKDVTRPWKDSRNGVTENLQDGARSLENVLNEGVKNGFENLEKRRDKVNIKLNICIIKKEVLNIANNLYKSGNKINKMFERVGFEIM